jgi:hypothetical protein
MPLLRQDLDRKARSDNRHGRKNMQMINASFSDWEVSVRTGF